MSSLSIATLGAILGASLAGSLHCVAMCGPLIAPGLAGGARATRLALLHAAGRLATYVALGLAAGAIGGAIDLAGSLGDVQRVATILAALTIFGWAIYTVVGTRRARTAPAPAPARTGVVRGWLRGRAFQRGLVHLRTRRPGRRAYVIGVLTGLLPCGWLWAFVVSAAGTGSPATGALVMAVFWLGTVPAMTGVLALGGSLIDRLRRKMPLVTAAALVALGVGTLAVRWPSAGTHGVTRPSCHEAAEPGP